MSTDPTPWSADGLLVGWSLEAERRRLPIGFARQPEAAAVPRAMGRDDEALIVDGPDPEGLDAILYQGNGHLMTVASTGAGKGVGCIIPALLRHPGSVIVIDPKGENHAVTARRRAEMGQQVHVLDPFGVTGVAEPAALNPLDLLPRGAELAEGVDDATMMAELIIQGAATTREPFWDMTAQAALTGIILYVAGHAPPNLRTPSEVRYLLSQGRRQMASLLGEMANSPIAHVREAAGIISGMEPKMAASVMSIAQNHGDFLKSPAVRASTGRTTIPLDDLTEGRPMTIYLVLPPDRLESHGKLLRLWIGVLMRAVVRRSRPPETSTLFLIDEAAQLGALNQLRQAITLLRGYGLQTWTFWQDLSQLKRLYPDDWETMLNNCRVLQFFGINNLQNARQVGAVSGFEDERELVELDGDEMLLCLAGDEPVIAQKPNYLCDPLFSGQFDPNPFHMRGDEDRVTARRPRRVFQVPVSSRQRRQAEARQAFWALARMLAPEPGGTVSENLLASLDLLGEQLLGTSQGARVRRLWTTMAEGGAGAPPDGPLARELRAVMPDEGPYSRDYLELLFNQPIDEILKGIAPLVRARNRAADPPPQEDSPRRAG